MLIVYNNPPISPASHIWILRPVRWSGSSPSQCSTKAGTSSGVFQIVPHEERAFNSKLLISQVLGHGLRIPYGAGERYSWKTQVQHKTNLIAEIAQVNYERLEETQDPNDHDGSLANVLRLLTA